MNPKLQEVINQRKEVLETLSDPVVILDKTGIIRYVNKKVYEDTGINESELIGKMFVKYIPAEELPKFLKHFKSRTAYGFLEAKLYKKGKELIYTESTSSLIKENGGLLGIQVIFRDVTEQKKMQIKIKESEAYLQVLFMEAPDAYFMIDLKGNCIDGNHMAEELSGYKKEELIGKNFLRLKLLAPADIKKAANLVNLALTSQPGTAPVEFNVTKKDGTKVVLEITGKKVTLGGKEVILAMGRDVTSRKNAESELKEKYVELEKMNKIMVGRELKIVELKEEIDRLKNKT